MRNDKISIVVVTLYFVIYLILLQFESTQTYGFLMLSVAPFLLVWMAYTILKYGRYNGPELGNEEFGYQDKSKDQLKTF
jgi:hypothetical protein